MNLAKLFWSNCRVKILEKFIFENQIKDDNAGFFIRELCRNIGEQINSVRRELLNLEDLKILKSREENKKKFYYLNKSSEVLIDIIQIFIKNFDAIEELKKYFKWKKNLDLITVSNSLKDLGSISNNVVDIFIIWEMDKLEFNDFLAKTFLGKKIKYAIMSQDDFTYRLSYNDKLVLNILSQKWNIFLKDRLEIEWRMKSM